MAAAERGTHSAKPPEQQEQLKSAIIPSQGSSKCVTAPEPLMRCCHCCSSASPSGSGCPRRAVQMKPALLGAAVSPLLWGVRRQQPSLDERRPIDDGHYMLDNLKPLNLGSVALTDDSRSEAVPLSTAGGWPAAAMAVDAVAARWRPSLFQCCYSYTSGALWPRPSTASRLRQVVDSVARIGTRNTSSDDV